MKWNNLIKPTILLVLISFTLTQAKYNNSLNEFNQSSVATNAADARVQNPPIIPGRSPRIVSDITILNGDHYDGGNTLPATPADDAGSNSRGEPRKIISPGFLAKSKV